MSDTIVVQPPQILERFLSLEIARVTERAAVSAARLTGHGDKIAADQAAVDAMRRELNKLPIHGTVVIGEGERDKAPMLFIGEHVGTGGPMMDIAVDPLDGTTLCAKGIPGAVTTLAIADAGSLLNAPDVYMQKIAVGPGFARGVIDLDAPADENVVRVAKAKDVCPSQITVLVVDRPRHSHLVATIQKTGASVIMIPDGDVIGALRTATHDKSSVDLYIGIGGAPEGVLAAAGLKCLGGQMQCRLILDTPEKMERASRMGIADPNKLYEISDMVRGDCLFAATGVTSGTMLKGVVFRNLLIETETIVMRSATGTVRRIRGDHREFKKFHLD